MNNKIVSHLTKGTEVKLNRAFLIRNSSFKTGIKGNKGLYSLENSIKGEVPFLN